MKSSIIEEIYYKTPIVVRHFISEYLNDNLSSLEERERLRSLEEAMLSQGDMYGHWWNSEFSEVRAYRQFNCPTLIIQFELYKQDLQKLLKRHLYGYEIFERNLLKNEVEMKYNRWKEINDIKF